MAVALLVAACGRLDTPAAFELDPSDTTWAVVEVDGRATDSGAGATLSIVGSDELVFQTRCQTITGGLAFDTDGSGWGIELNFEPAIYTVAEVKYEDRAVLPGCRRNTHAAIRLVQGAQNVAVKHAG